MRYTFNFIYIFLLQNISNLNGRVLETRSSYDNIVEGGTLGNKTKEPSPIHFHYGIGPNGPTFWSTFYPTCGGHMQSPINIDVHSLKEVKLENLIWTNYEMLPNAMFVTNNGHTLSVKAVFANLEMPMLSGGPLTDQYEFVSLHFHWGTNDGSGSEHMLSNKSFLMEMHCVHKKKDVDFHIASGIHNGLVVVGYFFDLAAHDNQPINNILDQYAKLMIDIDIDLKLLNTFPLSELMVTFAKDYVTYQGSLTTPPCSETVIWILSPFPVLVSTRQIAQFRKISQATGMENNFRAVQPLGNRTVYLITNSGFPLGHSAANPNDE